MKMMKAVVKKNEEDSTFSIEEIPLPTIQEDEYLIRVCAIGVGIHDGYFFPENMQYPYPIGIEAAGIIKSIGNETDEFAIGDRVAFINTMHPKGGTWAEYVAVSKDALFLKIPGDMSFTSAAAIPVAGNTILKAFKALSLQRGDSLFIAGASGAIGTIAIQLAKKKGIHIASSASLKNHEYMRELGVDLTVDYHDADWPDQVKKWRPSGVDAAIAIQPDTGNSSMNVIKDGGNIVAISDYQLSGERNISVLSLHEQTDIKKDLVAMVEQIANNEIQLTIEKIYPFDEALSALQKTTTRHARGKIVIDLEK